MTQEALKLALEFIENSECGTADLEACIKEALEKEKTMQALHSENERLGLYKEAYAQPEQEPVAWRTFDGEGGYDYCSYEDNESYADDWNKRNPNHKGWVDKLYTHPQRTWVGLNRTQMQDIYFEVLKEHRGGHQMQGQLAFAEALQAKLKERNT